MGVLVLHLVLLCIPVLSTAQAWTLTNVIHNMCHMVALHVMKGAPWEAQDQGKARSLTHWEQIDYGERFTVSRKFLTVVPVVLFVLTSFYTKYDATHFVINLIALVVVLVPKLPHFHHQRVVNSNHQY